MKYPGRTENRIFVGADFSSPKTKINLHIAFRIKVWHVASVGLAGLIGYLKMPKKAVQKIVENNPAKAGTEV